MRRAGVRVPVVISERDDGAGWPGYDQGDPLRVILGRGSCVMAVHEA